MTSKDNQKAVFEPITVNNRSTKGQFVDGLYHKTVTPQNEPRSVEMVSGDELAQVKKQAFEEAYQKGLEQAKQAFQHYETGILELLKMMQSPVDLVDKTVQTELVKLCGWLCKIILKREIESDPDKLLFIFDDLQQLLPSLKMIKILYINSEDYELIINLIEKHAFELEMEQLQPDKNLARGEYRLETKDSGLEATVESRLQELVLNTLGNQNESQ